MFDFLDVFETVHAGGKRRRSRFEALGRLLGIAMICLFFCLTIYALW